MSTSSTAVPFGLAPVAGALAMLAGYMTIMRNQRAFVPITNMDEDQLRDIGLTAADVRQARGIPFGQDPTAELSRLAAEHRHRAEVLSRSM